METRKITQGQFDALEKRLAESSIFHFKLYSDDNAENGTAKVRVYMDQQYTLLLRWTKSEITLAIDSYTKSPLHQAIHLENVIMCLPK